MRNAGLKKAQAGIKIAEGNINNLRYADDIDDDNLGPGSRVRNGVQKASGNPVAEWEQARAV